MAEHEEFPVPGADDEGRDAASPEGQDEPKVTDPSTGSGQADGSGDPSRKIDPETGEPREAASGDAPAAEGGEPVPAAAGAPDAGAASDDLSDEDRALLEGEAAAIEAERAAFEAKSAQQLDELQRLRAEFVNYRNRTERDRAGDRDATTASVIRTMLPALDDLDLAEKHGDLAEGPLAIVAQKLRASFDQLGVVRLGEVGEAFDIDKHEAVAQLPNPEVTEMVVADVVQAGYRIGDRMLRAAKVAVFVPAE
ncbi:nucleotide exchange factor GrpE [Agrococcus sediminis]|uniref:nucleotide exchange factor GrpE n=1 Tax=Agrococcus TaxID=46352 RepID=UPI002863FC6E|nr:nucleotide exchange factor GrpE [Agrococcus sp. BE272]MDR7233981.1 molecular chaperone GrpE [Agrococcus sp. BE272]